MPVKTHHKNKTKNNIEMIGKLKKIRDITTTIEKYLKVDALLYQDINDLVEAVTRRGEHYIDKPCMACLDGTYIANDIDSKTIDQMGKQRATHRKGV